MAIIEIPHPEATKKVIRKFQSEHLSGAIYHPPQLAAEEMASWPARRGNGNLLDIDYIVGTIGTRRRTVASPDTTTLDLAELAWQFIDQRLIFDHLYFSDSFPNGEHKARQLTEALTGQLPSVDNVITTNVHAACSGFVRSLHEVWKRGQSTSRGIVIAASEIYSPYLEDLTVPEGCDKDPSLAQIIFGDGATILRFHPQRGLRILYSTFTSFPGTQELIRMPVEEKKATRGSIIEHVRMDPSGKFRQEGLKVYQFILSSIPELIKTSVDNAGLKATDIKGVIPHPGSRKMVEGLAKKLPMYNIYLDLYHGNWSSASIPKILIEGLALEEFTRGDILALVGFGAGIHAGVTIAELYF